jgi:hypothetical protein
MLGRVFACLKGLLAKHKNRRHNDKSLTFLQLPVDVICLILKELPLPTKVLLSQTCRSMRTLLQDNRALIQSLSQRDYFNFLSGVADSLPNCVTCSFHYKLHIVDTTDLPYPPFASKRYPCSQGWTDVPCHNYGIQYRLSYWHIQLVLKYSRRQLSHQLIPESYLSCYGHSPNMPLCLVELLSTTMYSQELLAEDLFYTLNGNIMHSLLLWRILGHLGSVLTLTLLALLVY